MSDESIPSVVPVPPFEITELSGQQKSWLLTIEPNYLEFEAPDGTVEEVRRSEASTRIKLVNGWFFQRGVSLTIEGKFKIFKFPVEAFDAITDWVGPPTMDDLKRALRQRFAWVLPLGGLFIFSALPIGELPLEPVPLGLGIGLLLTGLASKIYSHRSLFLLDSLWFLCLSLWTVWYLTLEFSGFRLGFLLIQLLAAQGGITEFRQFAHLKSENASNSP